MYLLRSRTTLPYFFETYTIEMSCLWHTDTQRKVEQYSAISRIRNLISGEKNEHVFAQIEDNIAVIFSWLLYCNKNFSSIPPHNHRLHHHSCQESMFQMFFLFKSKTAPTWPQTEIAKTHCFPRMKCLIMSYNRLENRNQESQKTGLWNTQHYKR